MSVQTVRNADLIVINGRVLTMDSTRPTAEAVAVVDGLIAAVGDNAGSVPSSGVTAGEATAAFADCYAASS
ncbi:hypothetical protein IG197_21520 [Aminobacter sp. SR38]|uniref:hypothetical protein n=1 Tax=Aminobacter sp. SR38 TaxID=2774562 RepID=UPI0017822CEF|nr:hypothetical protein [Aminobacter sp. SR38]QOF70368.1 hypothetical protein IG197_21520 [Aminobacter sp. SR38]